MRRRVVKRRGEGLDERGEEEGERSVEVEEGRRVAEKRGGGEERRRERGEEWRGGGEG